jgi:hypothetical protein
MWRMRIASSRGILGRGCPQDLIAEVTAEVLGCSQVDLPSLQQRRQLDFNPRHADQARLGVRLEFDQQVHIAVDRAVPFSVEPNTDNRRMRCFRQMEAKASG